MAEKFTVKAETRETRGKNEARRMRAEGKVPVVIYGGEGGSVAASASLAELAAVLRSDGGANTVFSLDMQPRTTRAQAMDVLSSQANIAGYKSILHASY